MTDWTEPQFFISEETDDHPKQLLERFLKWLLSVQESVYKQQCKKQIVEDTFQKLNELREDAQKEDVWDMVGMYGC